MQMCPIMISPWDHVQITMVLDDAVGVSSWAMLANCCRWIKNPLCPCGQTEMIKNDICLLLGATGVGKTLLLKRLQRFSVHGFDELGAPPSTLPTVGTNLIDIHLKRRKKVTLRELGGCMGPIWPSYYTDASSVIFVVDSSNTSQISSSCIQLLTILAAEPLQGVSVLLIFNKRDMPCLMSLIEIKSLFRLEDINKSASQPITTLELSAYTGQGLQEVLTWLESVTVK